MRHNSGMAEKEVPVKPYTKNDGTAVSAHKRKIHGDQGQVVSSFIRDRKQMQGSLEHLADDDGYCRILGKKVPYRDSGLPVEPLAFNEKNVLRGCDLSGLDLRMADFSGMDLYDVDFSGCDLRFAKFEGSELNGVNLSGALIAGASLEGSLAYGLIGDELDLDGVNMAGASIRFDKKATKCVIKNLDKAQMPAHLESVDLSGEDLRSVEFRGTVMESCDMSDCNFAGSFLDSSKFKFCRLANADFTGTKLMSSRWEGVTAPGIILRDADLSRSSFSYGSFSGADMRGATLGFSTLVEINFTGANFEGSTFGNPRRATIQKCDFSKANFSKADVRGVDFADRPTDVWPEEVYHVDGSSTEGSDLTGVNWDGALTDGMVLGRVKNVQFYDSDGESVNEDDVWSEAVFDKYGFSEAVEAIGVSESQFEFLVLSGVIEVRDYTNHKKVTSGFDPKEDYVPAWAVQNNVVSKTLK